MGSNPNTGNPGGSKPARARGTRAIALVGPAGTGKTSLAEALLFASGAIPRQGSVDAGTSVGDASPEARARGGSTEMNLMHFDYLGDHYALVDMPGGVGFAARVMETQVRLQYGIHSLMEELAGSTTPSLDFRTLKDAVGRGPAPIRQRLAVVAGDMIGPAAAREELDTLEELLRARGRTLTPAESAIQEELRRGFNYRRVLGQLLAFTH